MTILPNDGTTTTDDDHENCYEEVAEALAETPGVVQVALNPSDNALTIDYDPQKATEQQMQLLASTVGPALQERFATCTWRLNRTTTRACEACALLLENRLQMVPGVQRASASFAGGVLRINYDQSLTDTAQLTSELSTLGLGVLPSAAEPTSATHPAAAPSGIDKVRAWIDTHSDALEILMTVLTFVGMVGGLIGEWVELTTLSVAFYGLAYAAGSVFGLQAGLASLRQLRIDVDLLMILAAGGAALIGAPFEGAMLLFLFSLSNVLQNLAMDRTRNAIRALMKLRPNEAMVRRGEDTVTVGIEEVVVGDLVVLRPGERVPLDGLVVEGHSSVDQAPITGESLPVEKQIGDNVLAGTINQSGGLVLKVTRLAGDTTLARLIRLVEEAQSEKATTQRWMDKFEQVYAVGVLVMTGAALGIAMLAFGEAFQPAFYRAMTLMVAASPCALVISTPATILSAIGNGARRGVLFKGGVHMEQAGTIKVLAFDKTGTLTHGKPIVTDIVPLNGSSEETILALAAAVEQRSEHPLAQAVVQAAQKRELTLENASQFRAETGAGVQGNVAGQQIYVGHIRFLTGYSVAGLAEAEQALTGLQQQGKTAVVVAVLEPDKAALLGVLGVADTLRENAAETTRRLKALGVERVVMLTGDNQLVAEAIGKQAGMDAVYADLMPEDKLRIVRKLRETYGPIAMVGDGVNDAPALAAATIGVAMGAAGTDVALETADVVLMADSLENIPYFIDLSRAARRTLIVNFAFALGVIGVLIFGVLGVGLALPLSVIGHEGSTVLVSLNGLRLLGYKGRKV